MSFGFFIIIILAPLLSTFFLYNRKRKWINNEFRKTTSIILFVLGFFGLVFFYDTFLLLLSWSFCIPLIYFLVEMKLKKLSIKKQNRDFILWLRYSDEIDNTFTSENFHVSFLDKLFSIVLFFLIWMLMTLGFTII